MIIIIDNEWGLCYIEPTKEVHMERGTLMEKKLRRSYQRERIYEYLSRSCEHPSAETVYNALRPEIPGLSLGTVYRNLRLLEELGMVRRVTAVQGGERYDAICRDHLHFYCNGCGTLHDVQDIDAEEIRAAIPLEGGYRFDKLELTITGLCPDCSGQAPA